MNKVLFLGHYRERSGLGFAAQQYILSLDAANVDVVAIPIKLTPGQPELHPRILELEKGSTDNCDTVVQSVLPHNLEYIGGVKNIAFAMYECMGNTTCGWGHKLNLMDEIWTPSLYSAQCFRTMGVYKPIKIVPIAADVTKYDKQYNRITDPAIDGNFIFYTIVDFTLRKNIPTLIKAFHMAFSPNYPVKLLIKTSKHGVSGGQLADILGRQCDEIKQYMKLYGKTSTYLNEVLLTDELPEEGICDLHTTGDCYVHSSHGDGGWGIPLFDAMGFGKLCIHPECPPDFPKYAEFTDPSATIGVESTMSNAFAALDTFPELYTSREQWVNVSPIELAKAMKTVYNNWSCDKYKDMRSKARQIIQEHSYHNVGQIIRNRECI